jgi:hypothetical protein
MPQNTKFVAFVEGNRSSLNFSPMCLGKCDLQRDFQSQLLGHALVPLFFKTRHEIR